MLPDGKLIYLYAFSTDCDGLTQERKTKHSTPQSAANELRIMYGGAEGRQGFELRIVTPKEGEVAEPQEIDASDWGEEESGYFASAMNDIFRALKLEIKKVPRYSVNIHNGPYFIERFDDLKDSEIEQVKDLSVDETVLIHKGFFVTRVH